MTLDRLLLIGEPLLLFRGCGRGRPRLHQFLPLLQPGPLRLQQSPLLSGVRGGQRRGRGAGGGADRAEGRGLAEPWTAERH